MKFMRHFEKVMVVFLCLFFPACSNNFDQSVLSEKIKMQNVIHFQFAIYYLPLPTKDPSEELRNAISKAQFKYKQVTQVQEKPGEPIVVAHIQGNLQKEYPPPSLESLKYVGRGIKREQAEMLQKSEQALILDFGHAKKDVWTGLRAANELVETIARETGGVLWDEETREIFSPDEWHRKRIAAWVEEFPEMSDQVTIHAYNTDEYVRSITLGMSKIGLPDIVVEDFSWSLSRNMGHLINLFCQSLAEGTVVENSDEFDMNIHTIKTKKVRDPQVNSLKPNATGIAKILLKIGVWQDGDPDNGLIELAFDRYNGHDLHSRQEEALGSLFGWEDAITRVKHSDELLIASKNAKAKLPALQQAFSKGLEPGEFIQVKVPFAKPDGGNEWMWVEITAWQGNEIKGLLKNEPFNIPTLQAGQIVRVNQEEVFDYIRRYPDGNQEGNETGAIIRKSSD